MNNITEQIIIELQPEYHGMDTIRALNTLRNLRLWRQWQKEQQQRTRLEEDVREAVAKERTQ